MPTVVPACGAHRESAGATAHRAVGSTSAPDVAAALDPVAGQQPRRSRCGVVRPVRASVCRKTPPRAVTRRAPRRTRDSDGTAGLHPDGERRRVRRTEVCVAGVRGLHHARARTQGRGTDAPGRWQGPRSPPRTRQRGPAGGERDRPGVGRRRHRGDQRDRPARRRGIGRRVQRRWWSRAGRPRWSARSPWIRRRRTAGRLRRSAWRSGRTCPCSAGSGRSPSRGPGRRGCWSSATPSTTRGRRRRWVVPTRLAAR